VGEDKNAKDEERANEGRKGGCHLSPENIVMPPLIDYLTVQQRRTLNIQKTITHLLAMRSCFVKNEKEIKKKKGVLLRKGER
jgi:hypothetical protein